MNDDAALLREFVESRSGEAFRELVERNIGLVYGAALRRVGDPHRAADITQDVFTRLARDARKLAQHTLLVAWLHTATRNAALNLLISEKRRKERESEADYLSKMSTSSEQTWESVRPLLDGAIDELNEKDRAAVVLRFLEKRHFADIARTLCISEDAARMRTQRAVERLRRTLMRKGITCTAMALATTIMAQPATSVPTSLTPTICSQLTAVLATASTATGFFSQIMNAKVAVTLTLVTLVGFVGGSYFAQKPVLHEQGQKPVGEKANVKPPRDLQGVSKPLTQTETNARNVEAPVAAQFFKFIPGRKTKEEIMAMQRESTIAQTERQDIFYASLYKDLNLDEEQRNRLILLKARQVEYKSTLIRQAILQTLDSLPARPQAVAEAKSNAYKRYISEVRDSFGDDFAGVVDAYEASAPVAHIFNRITTALGEVTPLSSDQMRVLRQTVVTSAIDPHGKVEPSALRPSGITAGAQPFVSPGQYTALQQLEMSGALSAPLSPKDFPSSVEGVK